MNSLTLVGEVAIARAYDDSGMIRPPVMELNEVLSVQRDDGALLGNGLVQDSFVVDAMPGPSCLVNRQNVVTECTQHFDHRKGEVFVGEEPGHRSGPLVLEDLKVDLGAVGADIRPGVCQVFGAQGGIAAEQLRFADA
jgi:hypothetical protein